MLIGIDASRAVLHRRTGTEAYSYFLIRALIKRTQNSKYQLRLYFNQAPSAGLFQQLPHVEFCVIPFTRLWTHVRLGRELQQRSPDVFFTPAHVIPFVYRGASVATVHDLGYHYFPSAHTKSQVAYLQLSTRSNGRLANEIITDSTITKADLIRIYNTDSKKISVIYPGLDPDLKHVENRQLIVHVLEKYGIESPYLLYMGTLQPRKNLNRLIRAFAQLGLQHQLVLGGKFGWQTDSLLREIFSLETSIRERVLLAGYIAEEDKAALLSGADALVYPSLYEGFGFPLLEAQVCGTPVMAANTSSLPEISAGSALLVDPFDIDELSRAMRLIVEDSALRQDLIKKGYENVRRFDWQKTANNVLSVLERATSQTGRT
jgi:glycosyltransferase involved in cell wall biosynthesis